MKVLLTTLNAKYVHSSLALRCLRASVAKEFRDLTVAEFTINDLVQNIVADIYRTGADIVCFSCYIWNITETKNVISLLKKVNPDITIILGGPEVSYETEEFMQENPLVDVVVVGEGEITFLELLRAYRDRLHLGSVNGIYYREAGMVWSTPARAMIENLSLLPSPYEDNLNELNNRIVYYECSRGCPFHCQFCLSSILDGVRYFPIERVKADIKRLIDHGVRQIKFVDRTFNIHKQYALEIFAFLVENRKDTTFHFEITGDILREDVIDYLVTVPPGIFQFEMGVQSTNDDTNRLVRRMQNFDRLSRNITRIKEAGNIHLHLDLIAGLPGEDYTSFRKTFNDVFALRAEELQLGFLKMLKGTGVKIRANEHKYVFSDIAPYEIVSNDVLSYDDVLRLRDIEDILEKYSNAHRVEHTLRYLIHHHFNSPFDFFEAFADYWRRNGLFRIGHRQRALYEHLMSFVTEWGCGTQLPVILDLIKFDFALHERSRQWPKGSLDDFNPAAVDRAWHALHDREYREQFTPSLTEVSGYSLRRHIHVLSLRANPVKALTNPEYRQEGKHSVVAVFYGAPDHTITTASYFDLSDTTQEGLYGFNSGITQRVN